MKRWLLKLALFLLLGAIVNVAVAWGTVLHDPPEYIAGFWREDEAAYSQWREWRRIRFYVREAFGRGRQRRGCVGLCSLGAIEVLLSG